MPEFKLVKTCEACPEQYDVFRGDLEVGYLRLRHGYFRAECHGVVVYQTHTKGNGSFTEDERDYHLSLAITAIRARLDLKPEEFIKEDYEVVDKCSESEI